MLNFKKADFKIQSVLTLLGSFLKNIFNPQSAEKNILFYRDTTNPFFLDSKEELNQTFPPTLKTPLEHESNDKSV